jgi:predicted permease
LRRRRQREGELDEEVRTHLRMAAHGRIRQGETVEQARTSAVPKFGNVTLVKEVTRDMWGFLWFETLLQDLRYGLRMLRKNPGFSLTVIVTLGLAIGLNAAIFSVVSGLLLREPPVRDPENVVMISAVNNARGGDRNPASPVEFLALRNQNNSFEDMAASSYDTPVLTGRREPKRVTRAKVTPNLFELFGVSAQFGHTFSSSEDVGKQQFSAVISYDMWQHNFTADPAVLGKSIVLAGQPYTVIGVMSAESKYAFGPSEVWTPANFDEESLRPKEGHNRYLNLFARLRKGVSARDSWAQADAILKSLARGDPYEKDWAANVVRLREAMVDTNTRTPVALLMGVVVCVLLIACANVAGIFLARSETRQNEFAVRAVLGASRWRLMRHLLGESVSLALLSGAFGFLLAVWGVNLLRAKLGSSPEHGWLAGKIDVNGAVLLFTLVVSSLTVLLSGLLPAFKSSKPALQTAIKEGGKVLRSNRMRSAFVIGQVALATVLVAATGAFVQILITEMRAQLGFDPTQMLNMEVSLSDSKYADPTKQAAFFSEAIQRIQSLPGVQTAGATTELPESAAPKIAFQVGDQPASKPEELRLARHYVVSPDYFRAMRIPLLAGRSFAVSDRAGTTGVAIINQTFSKRCFPKANPVGRYIHTYASPTGAPDARQIVGIVGDVIDYVGQTEREPEIYEVFLQNPSNEMNLVIRTTPQPALVAAAARSSIWAIDEDAPIGSVRTMMEVFEDRGAGDRLLGSLLGGFTSLALALAAIGIYGAVSYMATQRTREIGVRLALGAQRKDVSRMIVTRGVFLVAIGAGFGLVGAFPVTRVLTTVYPGAWLRSLLDLAIAPATVITAGLLASYIPARRATKVDPMVALRYE